MLDAGDVEEMVFVVVGQVTFHLQRIHPAVGLRDIDRRNAQGRKDITRHLLHRNPGTEKDRHNRDDDGPGMTESETGQRH